MPVTTLPSQLTVKEIEASRASAMADLEKQLSEESAKAMMDAIFAEENKDETRPKTT